MDYINRFNSKIDSRITVAFFLALTILLYLFRTTLPILKYPFIALFIWLMIYSIKNHYRNLYVSATIFLRYFWLPILLSVFLFLAFIFSSKFYYIIFVDVINVLILFFLYLFLFIFIRSEKEFTLFLDIFKKIIIIFACFISIFVLLSFLVILPGSQIVIRESSYIPLVTSDYNFALLPSFLGIISSLTYTRVTTNKRMIFFLNCALLIFTITIFLSGSRRGILAIGGLLIFLLFVQIISLIKPNNNLLKQINYGSKPYLISLLVISLIIWAFVFKTSYSFKNTTLELIGTRNLEIAKNNIASAFYRYSSIFQKRATFLNVYDQIWFNDFDKSLDPGTGWGKGKYNTVDQLKGRNVEIVPLGAKGLMLDSNCISQIRYNDAFSYTLIGNSDVEYGDSISASLYCYVSKDFSGGAVRLLFEGIGSEEVFSEYNVNDTSALHPTKKFTYNTDNLIYNGDFTQGKVNWIPDADSTELKIVNTPYGNGIRVSRGNGDGSWWSLRYTGRPILYHANHEYQIKFKFKVVQGTSQPFKVGWWVNDGNQGYDVTRNLKLQVYDLNDGWKQAITSYRFIEDHLNLPSLLNDFNDFSTVDVTCIEILDKNRIDTLPSYVDETSDMEYYNKGIWQKLEIQVQCKKGEAPVYFVFSKRGVDSLKYLRGHVIIAYPKYEIIRKKLPQSLSAEQKHKGYSALTCATLFPKVIQNSTIKLLLLNSDPFRRILNVFIKEDTTYLAHHSDLKLRIFENKFLNDRLKRWDFAIQIFNKEYNICQKLFGGGFSFLNWFGYHISGDKASHDYPHSPILSILLYSGVIGLSFYIFFLGYSIWFYIKYFKIFSDLSIFFIVAFLFSFFSSGSPFEPPIMGFLGLLPFYIRSFYRLQ